VEKGIASEDDLERLRDEAQAIVDAAYAAGAAAPWPDPSETLTDVYVSYGS
jgi:TPP-dependent pyruvate/acetoin dehydrogenase alpha subunit